tara:strand:+ start:124 stop:285 length:162 start_codon:yes stop_codon:yes gene_type:complete
LSIEKYKTFHLRNIPEKDWKKFKQITVGRDLTLNENLLRLLTDYVKLNYSERT